MGIRKLIQQLNENKVLIKERTIWKKKYFYQLKTNNKDYLNKEADSKSWEKIKNLFEKKLIKDMPNIRKPLYAGNLIEINDKLIQFKKLIKDMPNIRKPLYVGNLIEINDNLIQFKNFK